jgi:hypothetical protein
MDYGYFIFYFNLFSNFNIVYGNFAYYIPFDSTDPL